MKARAAALSPLLKRRGLLAAFGVALLHVQKNKTAASQVMFDPELCKP
jgi:hypothetical protein